MKCAIVNFAQFVRYLADRASIKLTQFAMKNVSEGHFECGIIFMFAHRKENLAVLAFALSQCSILCTSFTLGVKKEDSKI